MMFVGTWLPSMGIPGGILLEALNPPIVHCWAPSNQSLKNFEIEKLLDTIT